MSAMLKILAAGAALAALSSVAAAQDGFGDQPAAQQQPAYPAPQQPAYPQQPTYPAESQYPAQNPPQNPYPPQPAYPDPRQPNVQAPAQPGAALDQLAQMERQDFGVAPTRELHSGAMHGPTPASIPGGQVITTKGVLELVGNRQLGALVFDVLGGPEILPGALAAAPASQPGSFSDQTQQQFGQFLQQMTQGRKDAPLVFYCQSTQCWMSYNAALRAINMGYTNVLWYRGGVEAWKMAGQPVQGMQAGFPQQQPQAPDPRRPSPYPQQR